MPENTVGTIGDDEVVAVVCDTSSVGTIGVNDEVATVVSDTSNCIAKANCDFHRKLYVRFFLMRFCRAQ